MGSDAASRFLVSGPWYSKRLGSYLKVDPFFETAVKVSPPCVFCSLAPESWVENASVEVKPLDQLLNEIQEEFKSYARVNMPVEGLIVESFWEPTCSPVFLNLAQGLISLKNNFFPQAKLGVLSNGSQMFRQEIREAFEMFDLCWMRLDAGHAELHDIADFEQRVNALRKMRNAVIRSVFVHGTADNTLPETIDHWVESIGFIRPQEVHIATVENESLDSGIKKVNQERLHEIQEICQSMTGVPTCSI